MPETLQERLYRLIKANAVDIPVPATNRAIPMVALSDILAILQAELGGSVVTVKALKGSNR